MSSYFSLYRQKLDSFVPETYRMDVANERQEFLKSFQGMWIRLSTVRCQLIESISEGELWICKPTGANQVG